MNTFHDDPLDDLIGGAPRKPVTPPAHFTPAIERIFTEPCSKCRGSGRFYSYTGRDCGPCHACKGTGKMTFKTSREDRARAATRRAVKCADKAQAADAWRKEHAAEVEWLDNTANRQRQRAERGEQVWQFPIDLREKLAQYGTLTEGQIGAVRKFMTRDAQRAEARDASAPAVANTSKLMQAFDNARAAAREDGEGLKWLVLRLDTFTCTDAPAKGQWPAAVFVRQGDTKLGRIVNGRFHRSRDCDDATEARILAAIADPAAAAIAYGQRTGTCSCCGRELTNAESRARGIGPICAEKYGF
jgi:Family of unknown function (DUF6011)